MLKIENTDVYGWEAAIRGMRNPMNSWDKSDSEYKALASCGDQKYCGKCTYDACGGSYEDKYVIGENDLDLMTRLKNAGPEHAKYLRMITVTCDITAPLYLLKETDTYKVGTVCNSCSTMHKIHAKEFTMDDFSYDHLTPESRLQLALQIDYLNHCRDKYLDTNSKEDWWQMIQLLPSSYNQRRTYQFNYAVLSNIYHQRKNHKLDEWHTFCDWIKTLPYSELITE